MSNPRTLARLEDMLRYAQEAVDITKEKTRQDLDNERLLNLAVVRLLEIIGEAANKVTVKLPKGNSYRSISAPISASTHTELEERLERIKQLSTLHQKVKFQR